MIVFKTPGLVDLNALITFGVNVKATANPIGQFGTGFKYAVATILRLGGSVIVYRGLQKYEFIKSPRTIRDTSFDVVAMYDASAARVGPTDLGFTTQLGGHWQPWMAFRELLCNTIDESGSVESADTVTPEAGFTTIVVQGANFQLEFDARRTNFLFDKTDEPRWSNWGVELWEGRAPCIFYKRVRAHDSRDGSPFRFTYNLLNGALTEDRTLKYDPLSAIATSLVTCDDEALLTQILVCEGSWAEASINWSWESRPSEAFVNVVRRHIRDPHLNTTARTLVQRSKLSLFVDEIELTAVDASKLERARWFCKQIGYDVTYPVVVAASLSEAGILGYADKEKHQIILSKEVFRRGTKEVAQTLLEEHIHLHFNLLDESRDMQEHLFQLVTTLGEQVVGEAL